MTHIYNTEFKYTTKRRPSRRLPLILMSLTVSHSLLSFIVLTVNTYAKLSLPPPFLKRLNMVLSIHICCCPYHQRRYTTICLHISAFLSASRVGRVFGSDGALTKLSCILNLILQVESRLFCLVWEPSHIT